MQDRNEQITLGILLQISFGFETTKSFAVQAVVQLVSPFSCTLLNG